MARVAVDGCLVAKLVAPRLASGCGSDEQQQQAWPRGRERKKKKIDIYRFYFAQNDSLLLG